MLALFCVELFLEFGTGIDLYLVYPWIDIPMHFWGGVVSAWSVWRVYDAYAAEGKTDIRPFFTLAAMLISATALAGVLWEVYEFIHDIYLPMNMFQLSAQDTMTDLVLDIMGGGAFVWWVMTKR